jgi:hypothetical protein
LIQGVEKQGCGWVRDIRNQLYGLHCILSVLKGSLERLIAILKPGETAGRTETYPGLPNNR